MARTNPAAAAAAAEKFPPGYLRRGLVANLSSTLAQTDGPAAVAILQQMKVPPNDWAWSQLYGSWAIHDPASAATQLLTMPRRAALNNVDSLAAAWAKRDPAAATAWKAINPEAARAAVQNADLPEDARARLIEAVR